MKNETNLHPSGKRGASANSVMIPIIAALAVLFLGVVLLVVSINGTSVRLSRLTEASSAYVEDATSLLAGSSLLSETANNFVMMPRVEDGAVNVYPLLGYAGELGVDRRGDAVVTRFHAYNVSREAFSRIYDASLSANYLLDAQLHAISLVCSVYPLPDRPELSALTLRELTAEERALDDEQRLAAARLLILNNEYSHHKESVSRNVNACVAGIRESSARAIAETAQDIALLRKLLWIATVSIVVMLIVNFSIIYRLLITPLVKYAHLIETDEPLDDGRGLREVRLLAGAYNRLLKRRAGLEGILRSAAVTDQLTGLPNRYGWEQYLLDAEQSSSAFTVLLFDINYLKQTNDTLGHAAGDMLVRSAADCIRECFGTPEGDNCFRFGGDEFAAILKGRAPGEVERMTERFAEAQKERGISISWGCSHTPNISQTTFKAMMDEADQAMYSCKERIHQEKGAAR